MLLERYGKLTIWKSKSSRLSYSLVESLPPLSMMNVRSKLDAVAAIVIYFVNFFNVNRGNEDAGK